MVIEVKSQLGFTKTSHDAGHTFSDKFFPTRWIKTLYHHDE